MIIWIRYTVDEVDEVPVQETEGGKVVGEGVETVDVGDENNILVESEEIDSRSEEEIPSTRRSARTRCSKQMFTYHKIGGNPVLE